MTWDSFYCRVHVLHAYQNIALSSFTVLSPQELAYLANLINMHIPIIQLRFSRRNLLREEYSLKHLTMDLSSTLTTFESHFVPYFGQWSVTIPAPAFTRTRTTWRSLTTTYHYQQVYLLSLLSHWGLPFIIYNEISTWSATIKICV